MKKVLALVLALVMVCTLAMAITESTTGAVATTNTVSGKGYKVISNFTTNEAKNVADDASIEITTTTPKVYTKDDKVTTTYYADKYVVTGTAAAGLPDNTYYAVDASVATHKLVKDGKVVYLINDLTAATTTDAVSKVVKHAKNTVLKCGDYMVASNTDAATMKVATATTLYTINDKVYNGATGTKWAVLNGAFVKYTNTEATLVSHDFDAADKNVKEGVVTSVYCNNCDKYIPVVKTTSIPRDTLDKYAACGAAGTALADYSYLVKAAATTTTTNPDTGANDVIGVAAALAVVALVSGAAISLKK